MQIAIAFFDGMTALDAIGPYTVLGGVPGAEVVIVGERAGTVTDDRGMSLGVAAAFADVGAPDIIVVPGGIITHRMIRDGHAVIEWARAVHPTTTWTTSVCTGALLLGAAGILAGLDATTHWTARDTLRGLGANPVADRVVEQGKVITSAGVSSGIDMALTLAARIAGDAVAQQIQLGIEYDPQPPFDAGSPDKAPAPVVAATLERSAAIRERLLA